MPLLYAEVEYPISEQIFIVVILAIITIGLWFLRNTPLGFLWKIYKWFWIILFVTLFVNYAKKEIKDWWNK